MKPVLFGVLLVLFLNYICVVYGAAVQKHAVGKKKSEPDFFDLMNRMTNALARQDYVDVIVSGISIILRDENLNFLFKYLLKFARFIFEQIHKVYIFLFPSKKDHGSLMDNLLSGGEGIMGNINKAANMISSILG